MLQVKPQTPASQTAVPLAGTLHSTPQVLQFRRSLFRSTQALPHLVKVALHVTPQTPPAHCATPFVTGGQPLSQAPQ
jgi:hypothetical protein